jgi:hypothetical protein
MDAFTDVELVARHHLAQRRADQRRRGLARRVRRSQQ